MSFNNHIQKYFKGIQDLAKIVNKKIIEKLVKELVINNIYNQKKEWQNFFFRGRRQCWQFFTCGQ